MTTPHLRLRQLERIEAEGPTDTEQAHLEACPRCRIERRLFAMMDSPSVEPTWSEAQKRSLDQTLETGRQLVRASLVEAAVPLPTPPNAAAAADPAPAEPGVTDLPPPVGPWRVVRTLGRGGMGVVYLGEHEHTGARAAIKTTTAAHPSLVAAMRREALALAAIDHPGIVSILGQGAEGGRPWVAMEHVRGPTLRDRMPTPNAPAAASSDWASGWDEESQASFGDLWGPTGATEAAPTDTPEAAARLTRGEALTVALRLCDALAYLHGEGIVHRDLKPDNVLVMPGLCPVIIDFGLVARTRSSDGRAVLDTRAGVSGTASYMAPEQARGEPGDARADLYALGCILYEVVAGRPPFVGPTAEAVLRQQRDATPQPPSWLGHSVDAQLEALVMRLLSKDPARRLGYASDVATALAALGAQPAPGPVPTPKSHVYPARFVGRTPALKALRDAVTTRQGPSVVLVDGESGVGKTRLVTHFSRQAARKGFRVFAGECAPRGAAGHGGPLDALHAVLRQVHDHLRAAGADATGRVLADDHAVIAQVVPELRDLPGGADLAAPPTVPPAAGRRRLFAALTGALTRFAQDQPLLVILGDLHWAGELLSGWLGSLPPATGPGGLRVVGTWRTEEPNAALDAACGPDSTTRLSLGRMSEADVAEIVGQMLALPDPPRPFVAALSEQSEGNPFFVAETLRTAVAEGLLTRTAQGRWRVDGGELHGMDLPRSLRALVRRRLTGLSAPAQRVVGAAAVLGRDAEATALRALLDLDDAAVDGALGELERRVVLEATGPDRWRFAHDKLREEAYGGLSPQPRRALHLRAAEQLAGTADQPGALGRHWELGGRPDDARPCYIAAARQAIARFGRGEAAALYQAAIRLSQGEPKLDLELEALKHTAYHQGHRRAALERARQIHADATEMGAAPKAASAAAWVAQLLSDVGDLDSADEWGQAALRDFESQRDDMKIADISAALGVTAARRGDNAAAIGHHERSVSIYRQRDEDRLLGHALSRLAGPVRSLGDYDRAMALETEALERVQRTGDRYYEGLIWSNLGGLHHLLGRPQDALDAFSRAAAIHQEVGNRRSMGIVHSNLGSMHLDLGAVDDAVHHLSRAMALHTECGNRELVWWTRSCLGRAELQRGRVEPARAHLGDALRAQRSAGVSHDALETGRALAALRRVADHDLAGAEALLHEGLAHAEALGATRDAALCRCELGHVALARGTSAAELLSRIPSDQAGLEIDALRAAQAAWEAGERLVAGDLPARIPTAFGGDRG